MNKDQMKNRQALVQDLEDQIALHQSEIDCLKKAIDVLSGGQNSFYVEKPKATIATSPYESYPITEDLWNKIAFLEDTHKRFWKKDEMAALIREAEPDSHEQTLKGFEIKVNSLVKSNKMIRFMYNNSKFYCFYSTSMRMDWIEKMSEDPEQYQVLKDHEPFAHNLSKLSEEQLNPANISWRIPK